jgi:flagellar export protein FliJ
MPKAFEFRLERLLEVRRLKEEAARRDHAAAQQALFDQGRVVQGLHREQEESKVAVRALKQERPDVVQLRLQEGYQLALERRLQKAYETLHERTLAEGEKRRVLVEARKGVRVLERFREKQLKLWRTEVDLEEGRFLDEVGLRAAAGDPPLRRAE